MTVPSRPSFSPPPDYKQNDLEESPPPTYQKQKTTNFSASGFLSALKPVRDAPTTEGTSLSRKSLPLEISILILSAVAMALGIAAVTPKSSDYLLELNTTSMNTSVVFANVTYQYPYTVSTNGNLATQLSPVYRVDLFKACGGDLTNDKLEDYHCQKWKWIDIRGLFADEAEQFGNFTVSSSDVDILKFPDSYPKVDTIKKYTSKAHNNSVLGTVLIGLVSLFCLVTRSLCFFRRGKSFGDFLLLCQFIFSVVALVLFATSAAFAQNYSSQIADAFNDSYTEFGIEAAVNGSSRFKAFCAAAAALSGVCVLGSGALLMIFVPALWLGSELHWQN